MRSELYMNKEIGLMLDEAKLLINGDRREAYGEAKESFERIAAAWSAVFGTPVTAQQVILAMITFKVLREANKHKRDNLVDICGYAALMDSVIEPD